MNEAKVVRLCARYSHIKHKAKDSKAEAPARRQASGHNDVRS